MAITSAKGLCTMAPGRGCSRRSRRQIRSNATRSDQNGLHWLQALFFHAAQSPVLTCAIFHVSVHSSSIFIPQLNDAAISSQQSCSLLDTTIQPLCFSQCQYGQPPSWPSFVSRTIHHTQMNAASTSSAACSSERSATFLSLPHLTLEQKCLPCTWCRLGFCHLSRWFLHG